MHAPTRIAAISLSVPVALAALAGPLAGAAVADSPETLHGSIAVVPGSVLDYPIDTETRGPITRITFTERTADSGEDYPGTSVTTWSCLQREGARQFHCKGEGVFTGTYQGVTAPADMRITATCSETTTAPPVVSCEGRFQVDGNGALEGLRGHGTWQSSGVFGVSVRGTSEMRLHDHR